MRTLFIFLVTALAQVGCRPMEHNAFASYEQKGEDGSSLELHADEIQNLFITDKLDLVFVTDSHPDMALFYKKQLFGQDFLSRLNPYDWRFAYTNMSIDPDTLEKMTQEPDEEQECAFFSSLFQTVFGVFSEGLRTTASGLEGIGQCISSIQWPDFDTTKYTDGRFLPFEHKGEKWETSRGNCLDKSVENYNEIFDNSFRLNTEDSSFDAPPLTDEDQKSYPLLTLLLSLVEGSHTADPQVESEDSSSSKEQPSKKVSTQCQPFFRTDSVIVYVVITANDIQFDDLLKELEQTFDSVESFDQRLKFVSVTVSPRSAFLCDISATEPFSSSPKMRRLARKTGTVPLDLCSKNLPDKLFEEITKSLHPTDVLQ